MVRKGPQKRDTHSPRVIKIDPRAGENWNLLKCQAIFVIKKIIILLFWYSYTIFCAFYGAFRGESVDLDS